MIAIHIESGWDTGDGEGRTVEVTVVERRLPSEDPLESTRFFSPDDVEGLKRYVAELIDEKSALFVR